MIVYLARAIQAFVMYCVNGTSLSSLLIESTYSMILHFIHHSFLQNGWTPLLFAAQNGHNEAVKILVQHGAGVDMQNVVSRHAQIILEYIIVQ